MVFVERKRSSGPINRAVVSVAPGLLSVARYGAGFSTIAYLYHNSRMTQNSPHLLPHADVSSFAACNMLDLPDDIQKVIIRLVLDSYTDAELSIPISTLALVSKSWSSFLKQIISRNDVESFVPTNPRCYSFLVECPAFSFDFSYHSTNSSFRSTKARSKSSHHTMLSVFLSSLK